MTQTITCLCFLALLSGCAEPTYSVEFRAVGLTDGQVAAAQAAAAEWCEATNGACCPVVGSIGNVLASEPTPRGIGNTYLHAGVTRISIAPTVTDLGKWYRVVRHELGHACAAANRDPADATLHLTAGHIMAPANDQQPDHLTLEDVYYAS